MPATHHSLTQEIQHLLDEAVANGVTPAASCSVVIDGEWLPTLTAGAAQPETYFDLASVTKLFTTVTALSLVDSGLLELDSPIADKLPIYISGGKQRVTLRHLVTHTSGLPSEWRGWYNSLSQGRAFDRDALIANLLDTELSAPPGTRFEYSCAGFNTIMALSEKVTGQPWAQLVEERVLAKLPTGSISGTPVIEQTAPTEIQDNLGRGHIRGIVHDEAAWSLGGLSGNAGMFATSAGLAEFGEAIREGLEGILSEELANDMWKNQHPEVLGSHFDPSNPGYGHGLGLRINQQPAMGLEGVQARGHSGFTGTFLLIDKERGITISLLTNRVSPSRDGDNSNSLRKAIADAVYSAQQTGSERG